MNYIKTPLKEKKKTRTDERSFPEVNLPNENAGQYSIPQTGAELLKIMVPERKPMKGEKNHRSPILPRGK